MTTSPYTHPSMPGTRPMVLEDSAALEGAEPIAVLPDHIKALPEPEQGPALVEAIHARKRLYELWSYYAGIETGDYIRALLIGGRGHGKRYTMERLRAEAEARKAEAERNVRAKYPPVHDVPPVESVRWACKRPTAPVYPKYSNGWLMEMAESSLTAQMVEHNRKLNPRVADKVSALYDILGVGDHGSDDSQVQ